MQELEGRLQEIKAQAQELVLQAFKDNRQELLRLMQEHPNLEVLVNLQVIPQRN